MNVEYGYCHCGCGNKTSLNTNSWAKYNQVKGEPRKYILGHHNNIINRRPLGYTYIDSKGYVRIKTNEGVQHRYRLIAEKALGKKLPPRTTVHHIDEDLINDSND